MCTKTTSSPNHVSPTSTPILTIRGEKCPRDHTRIQVHKCIYCIASTCKTTPYISSSKASHFVWFSRSSIPHHIK
ncbi:GPI anchored protein [Histoplasma capsulatum G186AR]|uniref:GPI anchored protein n=1 Tax=Ajellomyces capsulatus TaxID=5037 RepID=A0A8H7Y8V2_AJECA|nr:GPI anchored protein [Histoplasma capsulatum]QSS70309.1 GPI anchored protein [Histoplasma capsulatum G186AR]